MSSHVIPTTAIDDLANYIEDVDELVEHQTRLRRIIERLPELGRHRLHCPVWENRPLLDCNCIESARRLHRMCRYAEEELLIPHP